MSSEKKISRRNLLTRATIFTATAGASSLLARSGSAQGKASKAAVHYQDYPKRGQMCGVCKFFIPAGGRRGGMMGGGMMGGGMMGNGMMGGGMMGGGMMGGMGPGMMAAGTCQVVEGRISPMGWCMLYAPLGT